MSPPQAGSGGRTGLGRLVDALRRRLRPADRGAPPATVPGLGSGEEAALAAAAQPQEDADPPHEDVDPPREDADARFDAARERLRARIDPPDDDD